MSTKVYYKLEGPKGKKWQMHAFCGHAHITVQDLKVHVLTSHFKMPRRVCNTMFDKIRVSREDDGSWLHNEWIETMHVIVYVNHPLTPDCVPKKQSPTVEGRQAHYKFDDDTNETYYTMCVPIGRKHITVHELKEHILARHFDKSHQECDQFLSNVQVLYQEDWRCLIGMPDCEWVEDFEVLIHVDPPLTRTHSSIRIFMYRQ